MSPEIIQGISEVANAIGNSGQPVSAVINKTPVGISSAVGLTAWSIFRVLWPAVERTILRRFGPVDAAIDRAPNYRTMFYLQVNINKIEEEKYNVERAAFVSEQEKLHTHIANLEALLTRAGLKF